MKRLVVKEDQVQSIKNKAKFIDAVQLSRILSAILYNKVITAEISEKKDTNTSLQLNLFINHAAVLYEGIKKFKILKERFENLESYQKNIDKLEEIFKENENNFYNDVLYCVRRKVAFHFDKHVISRALEEFIDECVKENERVILIQGKTDLIKDMTFLLADSLNLRYILKLVNGSKLSYENKFKIVAKDLLSLSESFCNILQEIIPELVKDYCELIEE